MEYENYDDFELIYMVLQKDDLAITILFKKYYKFLLKITYDTVDFNAITGCEVDDFLQVGYLSILKCVEGYRDDKDCSFASYVRLCFENDIRTQVRKLVSRKRSFLNNALPLDDYVLKEDGINYSECIADAKHKDPAYILIVKERIENIYEVASTFKDIEKQVFDLKMNGYDYDEICVILNLNRKNVYRIVQNIRRKLNIMV